MSVQVTLVCYVLLMLSLALTEVRHEPVNSRDFEVF
jgi:hypothetical protein